ncbi:VQ motif-containing protein [Corchorus capsularis]|uniref:VQ motif-containing protein n=1 Tax=Corchorus capsularis TaxID=210143 RepID=A0A1R3J7H0_COCAP|nr:VQ motif-containing protein [Corchorus capsularis]
MASSENLASIEPWVFRPTFTDSWISEAFARDTETLTRALQKSISSSLSNPDSFSPLLSLINPNTATETSTPIPTPTPTPSVSNVSGSDHETGPPKRARNNLTATGKVSKRKTRASKRSQTTFITADPANFRQMVQQVTGVRFGNVQMSMNPILKPEPQRLGGGGRLPNGAVGAGVGAGCLPTLDTSAFLLDNQPPCSGGVAGSSLLPFEASEGLVASAGTTMDSSEPFASFPTLESGKFSFV